jgi:hypothetical protein
MEELTEHANIYVALAAAQAEMGAPIKGSLNPAFRSKYADLADVVNAVAPSLSKHGIAFYHHTQSSDDRTLFMVTALVHGVSDTRVECAIPLIVSKQDMHGFKSATTYAKRIGLESVTGVAPEDDDGNAAAKNPPVRARVYQREPDVVVHGDDPGSQPEPRNNPAQAASDGLRDAWLDGIRDSLPDNASPKQFQDAVADALIAAFAAKKSAGGVSAQWDKRRDLIDDMAVAYPAAFNRVQEAFDARMKDFEPPFVLGEIRVG